MTSPILCCVGGGSRSGAAPPAIQQQRLPSQHHYLPLPIATHILYVCFYILTWVLVGKISVRCSQHKRPRHLKSCVGNTDPSGQNWSDILCRDDMSPTCRRHFRRRLPDDPDANVCQNYCKESIRGYSYVKLFVLEEAEGLDGSLKNILKHKKSGGIVLHMFDIFDVIHEAHSR